MSSRWVENQPTSCANCSERWRRRKHRQIRRSSPSHAHAQIPDGRWHPPCRSRVPESGPRSLSTTTECGSSVHRTWWCLTTRRSSTSLRVMPIEERGSLLWPGRTVTTVQSLPTEDRVPWPPRLSWSSINSCVTMLVPPSSTFSIKVCASRSSRVTTPKRSVPLPTKPAFLDPMIQSTLVTRRQVRRNWPALWPSIRYSVG